MERLRNCQGCCEPEPIIGPRLLVCAGCKVAHYCGRDCQKAHWKVHKKMCRINQDSKVQRQHIDGYSGWVIDHSMSDWLWTNIEVIEDIVFSAFNVDPLASAIQLREGILLMYLDSEVGGTTPVYSIVDTLLTSAEIAAEQGMVPEGLLAASLEQRAWHRAQGREQFLVFVGSLRFKVLRARPFILTPLPV